MKYSVVSEKGYEVGGDLLVCGVTEEGITRSLRTLNNRVEGLLERLFDTGEMRGNLLETSLLHVSAGLGCGRLLLVGLGEVSEIDMDVMRKAGGIASRTGREICASKVIVDLETFCTGRLKPLEVSAAVAEGAGLSLYRFLKHKSEDEDGKKDPSELVIASGGRGKHDEMRKELEKVHIIVESTNLARDLSNEPANAMTPTRFTNLARALSRGQGLTCRVLGREDMRKLGMGGILAVAAGSGEPPKLLVIEHKGRGKKARTVIVVGKGVTFDSGGISIKPSDKMEEMKFDKAGACSVLGIMNAAAQLKLPMNLIGLMPLSENLPGGRAFKPGDVVKMQSGKTVEVISTDAEGRMMVADALSYSLRYKPDAVIDIATLTGACVIALGLHTTAIVGNDRRLIERVRAAGERTGERVWELPGWKVYREQLKSEVADLKNVGGREAGTITAALFLGEFVDDRPWVHLDIAGTAMVKKDHPYMPRGATGVGVRLIIDLLRKWS
ncbi:MAG: leucyl aminopeptidase [Candidatus Glassbacteria bacterium]